MGERVDEILQRLRSIDIEEQIHGLAASEQVIQEISRAWAQTLIETQGKHPVAEGLWKIGPAVIPAMKEVLASVGIDDDVRVHAALVLCELGSKDGDAVLLAAVRRGQMPIAAKRMAAAGVSGVEEAVLAGVRSLPGDAPDWPYIAASFLDVLHDLKVPVPEDLVARFERLAPAVWQSLKSERARF